jgi:hypothetical protein
MICKIHLYMYIGSGCGLDLAIAPLSTLFHIYIGSYL